ncbi:MAG: hypothetical protein Q8J68_08870 [Methanolobus sp.]|uniref:hypothetical protein n=1 Tax=Methanolobus sp. TaxID=1874737 RepID=UPI002731516F|nr:hypothetical protein [Methanolobus sp.]MDP2217384.1 hypothetical protein [Methanolobus sp.]
MEPYIEGAAGLIVGIGVGIVIRAKLWWGSKTRAQKLALASDLIDSVEDGKVTAEEAKKIIRTHL